MTKKIPALMIIGQTASGKEKLALQLATHYQTDLISMDSMKIYEEMNIGTAKPPAEAQKKIKHHLINIIKPNQEFNVNEYITQAKEIAQNLFQNNKMVIFSGGTALYAKGLISGFFHLPEIDAKIKQQLEQRYLAGEKKILHDELSRCDPTSAKKIHENDQLRLIRALEVYYGTGSPISSFQKQFDSTSEYFDFLLLGIRWPRAILHERIRQRVTWMIEVGLEKEVKALVNKYPKLSKTSSRAVGYQELIAYFNNELSLDEAIERIIINTRQLCKHQMTWMRKFPIQWIDLDDNLNTQEILRASIEIIGHSSPFKRNAL